MPSNAEIVHNWVSDGTPAAEPVTVETPVEPAASAAPTGPARGPDGKFIAAEPAPPPETPATPTPAQAASAVAAPAPGASAQAVQEFIDAQLPDGTVFQVPKGLRLPMKRNGQVEYEPLEVVQSERMMERDYRIKTTEAQRLRREAEAERTAIAADRARVEARAQWLQDREAEMQEARRDPQAWEAYQQMMEMYQNNPRFRQTMDDALAKRETEAEIEVYRERDRAAAVTEGATLARGWISELAAEFPGINPERVATLYGQALTSGQAQLHPDAVRAIYQSEAQFVQTNTGPLQKELADLRSQVEALKAKQDAEKQNATTAHALQRAKTPPVATNGLPPAPSGGKPIQRFNRNELPDRNNDWARQR